MPGVSKAKKNRVKNLLRAKQTTPSHSIGHQAEGEQATASLHRPFSPLPLSAGNGAASFLISPCQTAAAAPQESSSTSAENEHQAEGEQATAAIHSHPQLRIRQITWNHPDIVPIKVTHK